MGVFVINSTPPPSLIKGPITTKPAQLFISSKPTFTDHNSNLLPPSLLHNNSTRNSHNPIDNCLQKSEAISSSIVVGAGIFLSLAASFAAGEASAAEISLLGQQLSEPDNALSLPTWAIHVSSVVEWIIAMVLVWQYGEKSGYESWKGLSWGMVPLLGGAFCACTWHFFYNAESLSVLVALQGALTVIGNFTMCIAAYRIYKSSQGSSENL